MVDIIKHKEDYITEFIQKVVKNEEGTVLAGLGEEALLALGHGAGAGAEAALEAARRGQAVWAPRETLDGWPMGPRSGGAARALRQAERLGVCPVALGELGFWLRYGGRQEGVLTAARLEEWLRRGKRGLYLPEGTTVTPLARKRAEEEHFRLERRGTECGWDRSWVRFGAREREWSYGGTSCWW